jgi:hypothetical protein
MIRRATAPRLTVPVNERDHILGANTAPVTLVIGFAIFRPYWGFSRGECHGNIDSVR